MAECLVFPTNLKSDFPIHFEVSGLLAIFHHMLLHQLVDGEAFPHGTLIGSFSAKGIEQIRIFKVYLVRFQKPRR